MAELCQKFNTAAPTTMHVDMNSCFASVEQQANPLLRGKPTVVAAYTSGNGCILAASQEAKALGIRTGMRVREGKSVYPRLIVLPPDPQKYRWVSRRLRDLLSSYTPHLSVASIDEMALAMPPCRACQMLHIARDIKQRIREEIGEWLTVSIGIAPNRYLAKVASQLHRPDGLDVVTKENVESVLGMVQLEDLCGIKEGNARKLRRAGIGTPRDFYRAPPAALVAAFHGRTGWKWWLRLHGYEDAPFVENFGAPLRQKTYAQSFSLATFRVPHDPQVANIIAQLIVKMGRRLRAAGYVAHGVRVSLLFSDSSRWVARVRHQDALCADSEFLTEARRLLATAPPKLIRLIAVTSFDLAARGMGQLPLWNSQERRWRLVDALDRIADRWGAFRVVPARMLGAEQTVLDRIAFGRVVE